MTNGLPSLTGPPDMLESSKSEKEYSYEGQAFQSGEDHRYFEGGGVNNGFALFMNNPILYC
jgi:hypothetical protein